MYLFFQKGCFLLPICLPCVICGSYVTNVNAVLWHSVWWTFGSPGLFTCIACPLQLWIKTMNKWTTLLRWLDTVFQGQYVLSLSINYVPMNKDLAKLPPQLYYIKMKICHDQRCNDIGRNSRKWRHYLFLPAAVFLGTGNCSSKIVHGSFFLQLLPLCSWSLSEICKSVIEIFWDEVLMVRNTVKKWSILLFGRYL